MSDGYIDAKYTGDFMWRNNISDLLDYYIKVRYAISQLPKSKQKDQTFLKAWISITYPEHPIPYWVLNPYDV